MRFLIDNNLSPKLADLLADAGHDASHVRDLGLGSANDEVVLDRARLENRILISADTDFGTCLPGPAQSHHRSF
jgi:predicted nuclease of predicted toxin-antitoxin system